MKKYPKIKKDELKQFIDELAIGFISIYARIQQLSIDKQVSEDNRRALAGILPVLAADIGHYLTRIDELALLEEQHKDICDNLVAYSNEMIARVEKQKKQEEKH